MYNNNAPYPTGTPMQMPVAGAPRPNQAPPGTQMSQYAPTAPPQQAAYQQYGAPPAYGAPQAYPSQGYPQHHQAQQGYPPQPAYGQPQAQYGYPAQPQYGHPQQQYRAPQQQYGAPPQQQYGAPSHQQQPMPQQYASSSKGSGNTMNIPVIGKVKKSNMGKAAQAASVGYMLKEGGVKGVVGGMMINKMAKKFF